MEPTITIDSGVIPEAAENCSVKCQLLELCFGRHISAEAVAEFGRSHTRSRSFKAGEQLYRAGDYMEGVAIVCSGSVESYRLSQDGEEQTTAWYIAGDWLPVMRRQAQLPEFIVAAEGSRLYVMSWPELQQLTSRQPEVFERLIQATSEQLEQAHGAMSGVPAEMRLARFLLTLAARYSRLGYKRTDVPLVMKKNRIANHLRLTPETLSRLLRRWREDNFVDTANHRLCIHDYEALMNLAGYHDLAMAA